jgi:hypothetical protein
MKRRSRTGGKPIKEQRRKALKAEAPRCVLPAPTQDAEVARLTRELASREAQEVT